MGVTPEQREIERKARELKLQEDRLERRLEQQQRQEDKLGLNQEKISQREKAVADKDQELKGREDQLARQLEQFEKEQVKHTGEKQGFQQARKRRLSFMLPVLLLAGAGAGYLTYDYYAKNDIFSQRLTQANSNVNKLSDVLTKAEDQKAETLKKLSLKEGELGKVKSELEKLKSAYTALEKEKSSSESSRSQLEGSKKALETSIATLTAEKEALLLTVNKLEAALAESTQQLNDSSNLMASMTKESEQLNSELTEKEIMLAELKNREERLVVELEEKSGVLIASKQAIDERDKILAAKVQRQSELELQLATLQEQHDLLNENRDKLAETLGEMSKSSEAVMSELNSLKTTLEVEKEEAVVPDVKTEEISTATEKAAADVPKP